MRADQRDERAADAEADHDRELDGGVPSVEAARTSALADDVRDQRRSRGGERWLEQRDKDDENDQDGVGMLGIATTRTSDGPDDVADDHAPGGAGSRSA